MIEIRVSKALTEVASCQSAQMYCCALHCTKHSNEPLKRKSCSAVASTIFESHFHGAKVVCTNTFGQTDNQHFSAGLLTPLILINILYHFVHVLSNCIYGLCLAEILQLNQKTRAEKKNDSKKMNRAQNWQSKKVYV